MAAPTKSSLPGQSINYFGHGMLFQTLDGKWLMSVHSHKDVNGRYIRTPRLFEVDFSGDKLVVGKPYIP